MKVNVFCIFLFLQAYYEKARAHKQGVNRMDDDAQYLQHQNIVQAIDQSNPAWFYGHSDNLPSPRADFVQSFVNEHGKCVYFTKAYVNNTNVKFTKHVFKKKGDTDGKGSTKEDTDGESQDVVKESTKDKYGEEEQVHLYGILFNTSIVNNGAPDVRNASNAIIVTKKPDEVEGERFKLIYSDSKDCSILRPLKYGGIPPAGQDQSYWTHTPTSCILLLSERAARGRAAPSRWRFGKNRKLKNAPEGMPQPCQWAYLNLCGEDTELKVVFQTDCPSIPNPLGC